MMIKATGRGDRMVKLLEENKIGSSWEQDLPSVFL